MNLVAWGSAIQIKKRIPEQAVREEDRLWSKIAEPARYEFIVGNQDALLSIHDWFHMASDDTGASACLFVHGKSGTGKSTAVETTARKFKFETITAHADRPRTPAHLDSVVREACVHGHRAVVVLDDFEMFLSETTSLRVLSKVLRKLVGETFVDGSRRLFVIISNSTHKLFEPIQDMSTVVHFRPLPPSQIHTILTRLANKVERHSHIPAEASISSSRSSSGTITPGINQLQLLYAGNAPSMGEGEHRRKKQHAAAAVAGRNSRDCISYLWSGLYTDKLLVHIMDSSLRTGLVMDRLLGFEKSRLDIVGDQLHREYPRRAASMQQLAGVADSLSVSDVNRMRVHADGLYEGENADAWSTHDICYISFVAGGVVAIKGQGRRDQSWSRKTHARLARSPGLVF
ncbi:unnamed protein product [Pylaiella littoralis]